jgi:hypothetical protein
MAESSEGRTSYLNLRVTPEELRRIQLAAERHKLNVSEFIRVMAGSEQWAFDQFDKLMEYAEQLRQLGSMATPPWTTISEEARQRAALIDSVRVMLQRVAETSAQMWEMLNPSVAAIEALLERLDRLAEEQRAARERSQDVSVEKRDA